MKLNKTIQSVIFLLMFLSYTPMSEAQSHQHGEHHDHEHADEVMSESNTNKPNATAACQQLVQAQVNGLVCDFCARALEKVFGKRAEVAGIDVNLDAGQIEIEFNPDLQIEHTELAQMITDSGYQVVSIKSACDT